MRRCEKCGKTLSIGSSHCRFCLADDRLKHAIYAAKQHRYQVANSSFHTSPIWAGIKLALSLIICTLAVSILFSEKAYQEPLGAGVGVLFFLSLIVLLWIPWSRIKIPLGLVCLGGILIGMLMGLMAIEIATGEYLPDECSGRRRWLCDVTKLLHALGGPYLASVPYFAGSLFFLVGCFIILLKLKRGSLDEHYL